MRTVDPKDSRDLQQISDDEGREYGERALVVGKSAIGQTLVKASEQAILASRDVAGASAFLRPASAMDKIRRELEPTISQDLGKHASDLYTICFESMVEGYATELIGSATMYSKRKTAFFAEATVDADDIEALGNYPILGHSLDQWVDRLTKRLEFDIYSVLSEPVAGQTKLDQLPGRLDTTAQMHARQCQQLAVNSHIAGGQAAQIVFSEFIRSVSRGADGD